MKIKKYGKINLFARAIKNIGNLFVKKSGYIEIQKRINLSKYDLGGEEQ